MSALSGPEPLDSNRPPRAYPPLPDWAETPVVVAHYSTGIFSAEDTTPAGSAMVFLDLSANRSEIFSPIHCPGRVAEGITDYLAELPKGTVLLHWNGTGASSGFVHFYRDRPELREALFRDGLTLYDFSEHLKGKYGSGYAGHPRLESVLVHAGRDKPGYLDKPAAEQAYSAGDWGKLLVSLVIKTEGIEHVYREEIAGRYRPPCAPPRPAPAGRSESQPSPALAAVWRSSPERPVDHALAFSSRDGKRRHSEDAADGPAADGRTFHYQGKSAILKPVPFRVAAFMWGRESAPLCDLARHVNENRAEDTAPATFGPWATRTNAELAPLGMREKLSVDRLNGVMLWKPIS